MAGEALIMLWKENQTLQEYLKDYITKGYQNAEILTCVAQKYPQYKWSLPTLKRRLKYWNIKRIDNKVHPNELIDVLKKEVNGPGQLLGIRAMHKKIRIDHGLLVRREDVHLGLNLIAPELLEKRRFFGKKQKFRKRAFTSKGSNWVWSVDGHDKLCGRNKAQFPLGIHGGIDSFSRKILWLKVWPSNCNPELPAKLFLDAVIENGYYPQFTRSDRGSETILLATLQNFLSQNNKAHLYGTSTTNHVIEQWWSGFKDRQGEFFKEKLHLLLQRGIYDGQNSTCRVILAYLYIPLIQKAMDSFVTNWNNHRIRAQNIYRPCGVVNYLYEFPEKNGGHQCGKTPNVRRFQWAQKQVKGLSEMKFLDQGIEHLLTQYLDDAKLLPVNENNVNDCFETILNRIDENVLEFSFS